VRHHPHRNDDVITKDQFIWQSIS